MTDTATLDMVTDTDRAGDASESSSRCYDTVKHCAIQYCTVQFSSVLFYALPYCTVQHCCALYSCVEKEKGERDEARCKHLAFTDKKAQHYSIYDSFLHFFSERYCTTLLKVL